MEQQVREEAKNKASASPEYVLELESEIAKLKAVIKDQEKHQQMLEER